MNSTKSIIYQVLRRKKILDYLEQKGYSPVKVLPGGKYQFLCPFPDHKETKPSFVVYTQAEFQNFHCYGCQRSYNIIHLVAELEGLSFKEALTKLSEGMELSLADGIEVELERIAREMSEPKDILQLEDVLMSISSICRNCLSSMNFDPAECGIIDRLFASVDRDINNCDFDNIYETLRHLPGVLANRKKTLKKKQLERLKSSCKL